MITRDEICAYVLDKYQTIPDYPFDEDFNTMCLRNAKGKWYALISHVDHKRLNIKEDGISEIINLKIEPELNHFLKGQAGVLPAYHMNKEHWITIILDSEFDQRELLNLIDMSYNLVTFKAKRKDQ